MTYTTEDFESDLAILKNNPQTGLAVRGAIARISEKVTNGYLDVDESVENNKELILAVQEKYIEQILAQDLNPNKDPELVDLRNGKQTAGQRIAEFEQRTVQQAGVNPLNFGAVGDGVTDDGQAIKTMHEYANDNSLKVVYPGGGYSFYISEVSRILIETSVDMSGSKLIIEDNPQTVSNLEPVFVLPDYSVTTHENDAVTTELSALMKKNFVGKIPSLATGSYKFVQVYDEEDLILPRVTPVTAAKPRHDMFRIDPDGYVLDPIIFDFKKVTKAVIHEIPKKIILNFGEVESTGNPPTPDSATPVYMWRNFLIERSNVEINGLDHEDVLDSTTKQHSRGIVFTRDCCQIVVKNSKLIPSKREGTYRMGFQRTLDILFDNVDGDTTQADRHSVWTGYNIKGFRAVNSRLNVISTHDASSTITVEHTKLGQGGIITAGFGELIIKGVDFRSRVPVQIRGDYGGFWDGNITTEDVVHYLVDNSPTYPGRFIQADATSLTTDFGVDIMLGRENISIKNLEIIDKGKILYEYAILQVQTGSATEIPNVVNKYKMTPLIEIDDVKRSSGLGVVPLWINGFSNLEGKTVGSSTVDVNGKPTVVPNIKIVVTNTKLDFKAKFYGGDTQRVSNLISPLPSEVYGYNATATNPPRALVPHFIIDRCEEVFASIKGLGGIIEVHNSTVRTHMNSLVGGSRSVTLLVNCDTEPYIDKNASFKPIIRGDYNRNTFINCRFKLPINQDGKVSPSSQSVLDAYEIFSNVPNNSAIRLMARLIGCTFEDGMNLGVFNENLAAFTQNHGTTESEYWLRNIGELSRRPTVGLYTGFSYFSTTDKIRYTWDGVAWL